MDGVVLTWLISTNSKTAVAWWNLKPKYQSWQFVHSCDVQQTWIVIRFFVSIGTVLSLHPLRIPIASGTTEVTVTSPFDFPWQSFAFLGRTLWGICVIFKQSHFDVVHSIIRSNQSPSGSAMLMSCPIYKLLTVL